MAEDFTPNPLAEFRLRRPPFWLLAVFLILIVVSWLPLVVAARRRVSTSEKPRIHLIQDMDNQPRYKAQHASPVFADGRADRPAIPGTVARDEIIGDDHLAHGFARQGGKVTFFTGYPKQIQLNEKLIKRGQLTYNIYCAPCHGLDGYGQGPVNQRALELSEPRWVQAASLHDGPIKQRPEGHLFNTITVGIRNMPGYGSQISVHDRWAVVAYVRALQLSQDAPANAVPKEKLTSLK
jgi:mono/diheme cytochrome c family protein